MTEGSSKSKENTDLDDALEMTFPASDPVSVSGNGNDTGARPDRKTAPLDRQLVERLSNEVKRKQQLPN